MCGISGYIGDRNAQKLLVGGLRRMEYRGYDSAGMVTLNKDGAPTLLRAKGKVSELATPAGQRTASLLSKMPTRTWQAIFTWYTMVSLKIIKI